MVPMRWAPVGGNCNDVYQTGDDPVEYVRCTAVENHEGLHRCHFQPYFADGSLGKVHLMVWGETSKDVSIDELCNITNPLGLIPA